MSRVARAFPVVILAAMGVHARVLPETLLLPQCEFYPLREQDRGFLHRYVDQPLFVDPDLPEDVPCKEFETRRHRFWGEWFSQADWNRAQELGKDFGFDGFAFFPRPHRIRYWDAMEKSPVHNFLSVPIAYNKSEDGADLSQWVGHAVRSTKGYRFNGKTIILSYRYANRSSPSNVKMKMERMRREFGDTFLFVCDVSKILNPDEAIDNGQLSEETVRKYKSMVREYLRACDGVMVGDGFSVMNFEGNARVFFSSHYEQIVKMLKETVNEPEFAGKKLLGLSAVLAHENHTIQFWTAGEDGLRTLTESLRIACAAEPDIILLPEWDELNENTCVGPTLSNGLSVKRILGYFKSGLHKMSLCPIPGDNLSVPNLIVSYRRSVSPGERLIVDVLNIPDGGRKGKLNVSVEILNEEGASVMPFESKQIDECVLSHMRFPIDSATLAEKLRTARVKVRWFTDGSFGSIADGLHPIDLTPASGYCLKEVHQPIRDIVKMDGETKVEFCNGRINAKLKCDERIRYAYICGNGQIQHVIGDPESEASRFREDETHAVFSISGVSPKMLDRMDFRYRVDDVSMAEWLDCKGLHRGVEFRTDWLSDIGDPYYLRLPKVDIPQAKLAIDFKTVFNGSIPLQNAFERGVYAVNGRGGVQFAATRLKRQSRYPSPVNRNELVFNIPVDGDRRSMVYHVQLVTMDGRTWRSRPFVAEVDSGISTMRIFSAVDGMMRDIRIPFVRIPKIEYDVAGCAGTYLPTKDGFLHFATILGGRYSMATLWNRCSSSSNDAPPDTWPQWSAVECSVPERMYEPDGSWSLCFDGIDDFITFPWETVPQNSAYTISFDIYPLYDEGKFSLFASKFLLNMYIDGGILHASAAGVKDIPFGLHVAKGKWQNVRIVHTGDSFSVSVGNRKFVTSARLPARFMSPLMFALPVHGTDMKPFKGKIRNLSFYHGSTQRP